MAFTAFFDSNVLYPSELRSFLIYLALTDLFRAKWSEDVHKEWMTSLLKNRPDLSLKKLKRTRMLMDIAVPDALVRGYKGLIPSLRLPDPKDRHVLAAAIRGRADVIVTANLRDFQADTLQEYDIEAQHPDEFSMHLFHLAPETVCSAAREHQQSLKNPAKTGSEYLQTLSTLGLLQTASALKDHLVQ